jgi:hypothetical protein
MKFYATVPIANSGQITESYDVQLTGYRPVADTGRTDYKGTPIYETEQFLLLEDAQLTPAKEADITGAGGQVFASADQYQTWFSALITTTE